MTPEQIAEWDETPETDEEFRERMGMKPESKLRAITRCMADIEPTPREERVMWLIWSIEHNGWWRPNQCGYTNHRELAGRYFLSEARKIMRYANAHITWEHFPNEKMPIPNAAMIPAEI